MSELMSLRLCVIECRLRADPPVILNWVGLPCGESDWAARKAPSFVFYLSLRFRKQRRGSGG